MHMHLADDAVTRANAWFVVALHKFAYVIRISIIKLDKGPTETIQSLGIPRSYLIQMFYVILVCSRKSIPLVTLVS